MLTRKITTSGNSASLTLSQDVLGFMGVAIGDEVQLDFVGRTLIVRPIDESRREAILTAATNRVLSRRKRLMERLAEGAADPKTTKARR